MLKAARTEWELTFIDILDKINKQMSKYATRERRELEKSVGADSSAKEAPLDYKSELRKRAASRTGVPIRTRIRAVPTETNGENP